MIIFKPGYPELERQFEDLRSPTDIIVFSVSGILEVKYNLDLIVTSIRRPGERMHGDYRSLDFRIQQKGQDPYIGIGEQHFLIAYTGNRFIYDPARPHLKVLVIHENRINGLRGGPSDGIHGHLQSYPGKTEIRK